MVDKLGYPWRRLVLNATPFVVVLLAVIIFRVGYRLTARKTRLPQSLIDLPYVLFDISLPLVF